MQMSELCYFSPNYSDLIFILFGQKNKLFMARYIGDVFFLRTHNIFFGKIKKLVLCLSVHQNRDFECDQKRNTHDPDFDGPIA